MGLSVAAARVLGLTAADLGEGSVDGITGGNIVHQVEEPGMNAATRCVIYVVGLYVDTGVDMECHRPLV